MEQLTSDPNHHRPSASAPPLYVFDDGEEMVIAHDPHDAERRWAVYAGGEAYVEKHLAAMKDRQPDYPSERWEQVEDEREIKIWCDEAGKLCEHGTGTLVAKKAVEWAAEREGYLCCFSQ